MCNADDEGTNAWRTVMLIKSRGYVAWRRAQTRMMHTGMRPGPPFDLRKLHAIHVEPWKNGAGFTRELARGAGWRISVAEVAAPGPFSVFAGRWRHSVVIGTGGLDLRSGADALALDPMRCVRYDGGTAWHATLRAGPTRVFNVMTNVGEASAQVLLDPALAAAPHGGVCLALCVGTGLARLDGADVPLRLAAGDFFLFDPAAGTVRFERAQAGPGVLLAVIAPPAATSLP
ncbi:MAG: hypothetical protein EOO24_27030 [Comamonadaceae bacterium]|nr:MAG: hypothetical protein EOO24_27030 [Comamonadaceae bacterium]